MARPETTIDVVSDVVCPWCYLGKRRLERALRLLPEGGMATAWRPFRLDPTIPPGGIARETYLTRKFGSVAAVADSHRRLTDLGRDEGIDFRFDLIARSPNTVDAHRLIRWAETVGRQDAMVERLFRAYFSEGLDVGDTEVLVGLAGEVGLGDGVAERLAGDDDRAEVAGEIENAYRIGVSGVPCFIVNRRCAVMGAQPGEVLARTIMQASEQAAKEGAAQA